MMTRWLWTASPRQPDCVSWTTVWTGPAWDSAVSLMSRSGRETLSEQVLKVSVCVQVSEGSTGWPDSPIGESPVSRTTTTRYQHTADQYTVWWKCNWSITFSRSLFKLSQTTKYCKVLLVSCSCSIFRDLPLISWLINVIFGGTQLLRQSIPSALITTLWLSANGAHAAAVIHKRNRQRGY